MWKNKITVKICLLLGAKLLTPELLKCQILIGTKWMKVALTLNFKLSWLSGTETAHSVVFSFTLLNGWKIWSQRCDQKSQNLGQKLQKQGSCVWNPFLIIGGFFSSTCLQSVFSLTGGKNNNIWESLSSSSYLNQRLEESLGGSFRERALDVF